MGALKGHLSSEGNVPSFLKPSLENKYEVGKNQIELLGFFFCKMSKSKRILVVSLLLIKESIMFLLLGFPHLELLV